jgi:hypothetical protein
MRRVLVWILGLGVIFAVFATFIAPSVLGWYFTPPARGKILMEGDDAVRWGMHRLIQTQAVAFIIGALLGAFFAWRVRDRKPGTAELPPPRSPANPAPVGPGGRTPTSV